MPRYLPNHPRPPASRDPWAVQAADAVLAVALGLLLGSALAGASLSAGIDLTVLLPEIRL